MISQGCKHQRSVCKLTRSSSRFSREMLALRVRILSKTQSIAFYRLLAEGYGSSMHHLETLPSSRRGIKLRAQGFWG